MFGNPPPPSRGRWLVALDPDFGHEGDAGPTCPWRPWRLLLWLFHFETNVGNLGRQDFVHMANFLSKQRMIIVSLVPRTMDHLVLIANDDFTHGHDRNFICPKESCLKLVTRDLKLYPRDIPLIVDFTPELSNVLWWWYHSPENASRMFSSPEADPVPKDPKVRMMAGDSL